MAANFLCAILSGPFLLSIHPNITSWGFLGGLLVAVVGLLLCALITQKAAGEAFSLSFFAPEDISSLPYLIAFIVAPIAGAVGTALISKLDIHLNKRAAAAAAAAAAAETAAAGTSKTLSLAPNPSTPQPSPTGLTGREASDQSNSSSNNSNSNRDNSSSGSSSKNSVRPQDPQPPEAQLQSTGVADMT
ncbi:sodium:solute symporter family domain-containing protein, putative [Eimeria praecox]|uniref:Sodium:solute symporter family domain-containing protein, putative n=1 Tax=Eimeria praecox TaxID=51316 RepID=U6G8R3_9EIME|nr:sodium:solute symporter family domain-containing protein, putative [Eimeria praecox]